LTIAVSTIISAFNSLTLSPALTALLLRPIDKTGAAPLPSLAFPAFGAFAAYWWGMPWIESWVSEFVIWPDDVKELALPAIAIIGGGLLGWIVSRPFNWLLATAFRGFNASFRFATRQYAAGIGKLLHFSGVALVLYGGLLVLTYFGFITTPK